jgi:hypothetical protein
VEGLYSGKVRYEVEFRPRDSSSWPSVGQGCSAQCIDSGEGTLGDLHPTSLYDKNAMISPFR